MPRRTWSPRFAMLGAVDLDTATGSDLFHRGGDAVGLAQRLHEDSLALAHGRCSPAGRSLPEEAATLGYTIAIDRDDRVVVAAEFPFDVTAGTGNRPFGFAPGGQSSELTGEGFHVVRAAHDWVGGPIDARFTLQDGGGSAVLPSTPYRAASVVVLMRRSSLDDIDAGASVTGSLQAADNAVHDPVEQRIRWGLDALTRVFCAWPASLDLPAPTITHPTFRYELQLDGTEARQSVVDSAGDTYHLWTAARPAVWNLSPSRPVRRITRGHEVSKSGGRTRAGVNVLHENWRVLRRTVQWYIDGPSSLRPQVEHTDRWLQNVGRFTLYQCWGDPRRAVPPEYCDAVEGSGPAPYDLVYTSEAQGERGRMHCSRDAKSFKQQLAFQGAHRKRGEHEMTVDLIWQPGARWPVR